MIPPTGRLAIFDLAKPQNYQDSPSHRYALESG